MDEMIKYMEYMWVQIDDNIVTVGISEEGLESFDEIERANMPEENTEVATDEACGELDTDQGPFNLYSPVDGIVVETNEATLDNPKLIMDDPLGDGWLYKIEADNPDQIDELPDKLQQTDEEYE